MLGMQSSVHLRLGIVAIVLTVLSVGLAGCGGDDPADPVGAGSSGSSGSTATSGDDSSSSPDVDPNLAYGLKVPPGVKLTELGSDLSLGDTARVAWQVEPSKVGVVALTVTKLRRGSVKDFSGFVLDEATQQSTPFYVDATVRNLGRSDLSGVKTPLLLLDGNDVLVRQSTFQSTFTPCAAEPLPEKFKPGRATKVCLVFIAADHGSLAGVTFRPDSSFDPIQWTGELTAPKVDKPTKKKNKKNNG
ncbi:conserved exported hypothetical protein [metagenome]|uniref:Uncharacterized protein n=1 Tax=metagenome TaxID=256318 RepID=A0A2P2BX00_9ZZZZ